MPLGLELELAGYFLKRESRLGNNTPQSPSRIAMSMAAVTM